MIQLQSEYSKNLKVFNDTLIHIQRITNNDIIKIIKIDFDYNYSQINKKNIEYTIDFGDTGSTDINYAVNHCYSDSLYIGNRQKILIGGLEHLNNIITQNIGGVVHVGDTYAPKIYEYDINSHSLRLLYSKDTLEDWTTFLQGSKIENQPVLMYANPSDDTIHMVYKTLRTCDTVNTNSYILLKFSYLSNSIELVSSRVLLSSTVNGDFPNGIIFRKCIALTDSMLMIGTTVVDSVDKVVMMKIGSDEITDVTNYIITEDGRLIITEDGQYMIP